MIRIQHHPEQLRIDTQIKLIDKDGDEMTAPVVILVGLTRIKTEKQQYNLYKIVNTLFNKDFTLDRRKPLQPKKPWYKFW